MQCLRFYDGLELYFVVDIVAIRSLNMAEREKTCPQEESGFRNDDLGDESNWEGTNTTFTGSTSEAGFSFILKPENNHIKNFTGRLSRNCSKYAGCFFTSIVSLVSYLSPIVMIILPKIEFSGWKTEECYSGCEGLLIGFGFKLMILLIGSWALFWRRPRANMPRVFAFRAVVLALLFVLSATFWLFYGVTILAIKDSNYQAIVGFATTMVDCLLFVHYLAVILLEIRHLRAKYIVKVVRSPDGFSCCFTVGQLSIQRLAIWCLDRYHCDFDNFNPYLDRMLHHRSKSRVAKTAEFKIYDIDSCSKGAAGISKSPSMIRSRGKESGSHNERFYQEEAYERKVKKRKARLICAAEESFANIRQLQADRGSTSITSFIKFNFWYCDYLNLNKIFLRGGLSYVIHFLVLKVCFNQYRVIFIWLKRMWFFIIIFE